MTRLAGHELRGERPCVCGCPRIDHTHYRRGTGCVTCHCPRYKRKRPWRRRKWYW